MIRIIKSNRIPKKLLDAGQDLDTENRLAYDANSATYSIKSFSISPDVYGHHTVKKKLKEDQHTKCCYCEDKRLNDCGQVEHFRPKSGYVAVKGQSLIRPGYYWLGYNWTNLYFICSECNWRKSAYFPIVNERERLKSHHDANKIDQEKPLILDPGGAKDPRDHIVFERELVEGITPFGEETIKACGLNREDLNELRRKLISNIECRATILKTTGSSPQAITKAAEFIKECQQHSAEFSAAAIDFIKTNYPDLLIQQQ